MSDKALFIPLKTEYYRAFENGSKTTERRIYGKRWNENTCKVGRKVTLSKGYGKSERMHRVVTGFSRTAFADLPNHVKATVIAVYGSDPGDIAQIEIGEIACER